MGTSTDVRWITPLPLWTGILAGPLAWAIDLSISYAIVEWTCASQRETLLHAIPPAALAIVAMGAAVSTWRCSRLRAIGQVTAANLASERASWRFSA